MRIVIKKKKKKKNIKEILKQLNDENEDSEFEEKVEEVMKFGSYIEGCVWPVKLILKTAQKTEDYNRRNLSEDL